MRDQASHLTSLGSSLSICKTLWNCAQIVRFQLRKVLFLFLEFTKVVSVDEVAMMPHIIYRKQS